MNSPSDIEKAKEILRNGRTGMTMKEALEMAKQPKTYRGWSVSHNFIARKGGTTIYGDNWRDIVGRIDFWMDERK